MALVSWQKLPPSRAAPQCAGKTEWAVCRGVKGTGQLYFVASQSHEN
jgi:hypothetical protein